MSLPTAFQALGRVFVSACIGTADETRAALEAARAAGTKADDVDEALLLVIAYAGVPRAILAFTMWRETAPTMSRLTSRSDRRAAGDRTFLSVYGSRSERIKEEIRGLHPVLLDSVIEDSYGRILSRRGLAAKDRELLSVAMLVGLQASRQAAAHALGAKSAGASDQDILQAAALAEPWIGAEARGAAQQKLAEMLKREK